MMLFAVPEGPDHGEVGTRVLNWLLDLPIQNTLVLAATYAIAFMLLVALVVPRPGSRGRIRVRLAWTAAAAGLGATAGLTAVWLVVDVEDVFGTPASTVIRAAAAGAGAGVGVAVANLVRTRWWRKAVAVVSVVVFVTAGGFMINRDVAYYPRLGDVFGQTGVGALVVGQSNRAERTLRRWKPPADMPASGTVGTASIPGLESHWHARKAWIYLPPAARVADPPKLPVLIAFSGQPGQPSDVFEAGDLQSTLDAIASAHQGIAPIVVVPDQLGSYNVNPMCVNSKMGHVATYVTVDVRSWILKHLPVSASRREWAVAGFSEGATCAVQFGTAYPAIFSGFLAISPEIGPINGSVSRTLHDAFHNDKKAWEAAQPIAIMHRHRPYRRTIALYAVGALDKRYGAAAPTLAAVSRSVGMDTSLEVLPDMAHNWNTASAGFEWGLPKLATWWALP